MTNEKLSDIEIKIINTSRKFAKELNKNVKEKLEEYSVNMDDYKEDTNIEIEKFSPNCRYLLILNYLNNAESGKIRLYSRSPIIITESLKLEIKKNRDRYGEMLVQDIPEIKDRLKIVRRI